MKTAWIMVASLALASCGLHGRSESTHESQPPTPDVASRTPARVVAPGIVEPWDGEVSIAPRETGWIAEILVAEGDQVVPGQTLAILDDAAQRAAVASARAEVEEAQAEVTKLARGATAEERRAARATAAADDSRAAFARDQAERTIRLADRDAAPRMEAERASTEAAAQMAVADASAARRTAVERGARTEDRLIAKARLASARARLELAEANLARRRVTATIKGTVLVSRYHPGELFAGAGPMFVVGDISRLRLRLEVDEIDALQVAVGAAADVFDDGGIRVTTGTVLRVAPRMGRRTLSQENPTTRADTRVREMFVELAANERVVPGMRLWGHTSASGVTSPTASARHR